MKFSFPVDRLVPASYSRFLPALLLALAVASELLWLGVTRSADPTGIPDIIRLLILLSILYFSSIYTVLKAPETLRWPAIFTVALIFRLTVFPLAPLLSDDLFRYRWEGQVQLHRANPYATNSLDPRWQTVRDATWARVPIPEAPAGYGPLTTASEAVTFWAVSRLTGAPENQAFWMKLPALLFDLAIMLALLLLLRARGLPLSRFLIYAWSPLPVVEFWWSGHNDAMAVFGATLALALLAMRRPQPACAALGAGIAAKLWPVLLLPLFYRQVRRRHLLWVLAVPAPLALYYWADFGESASFLSGYALERHNNESLFGLVWWLTGSFRAAKLFEFGAIAVMAVAVPWWLAREWLPEKQSLAVITGTLLCSANVHPWYLTWLLPLTALFPWPPLFVWMALMPLSYEIVGGWLLAGKWQADPGTRCWIYLPSLAAVVFSALSRRRVDNRT